MSISRERADLIKKSSAQAAAAGIGLAAGGPAGALIGAAAGPAIELLLLRQKRSMENINLLMDTVTELCNLSPDEFARWARLKEGRLFLTTSAMQAAVDARSELKIRALARVLAENVHDDARIDLAGLAVTGLAELEPPHIRVLHALVHQVPKQDQGSMHGDLGWECSALKSHLPSLADALMPIIAVLCRTGMATESPNSSNRRLCWTATRFGMVCMNYLHDVRHEHKPESRP
jgi:hypothetical protein